MWHDLTCSYYWPLVSSWMGPKDWPTFLGSWIVYDSLEVPEYDASRVLWDANLYALGAKCSDLLRHLMQPASTQWGSCTPSN